MKNNTQPALKERIEKALEDFTKGRTSMHVPPLDTDVDVVLAECSDRLSELKARCAALAAENAGLKAAFDKPQAYLSWHTIPPTWEDPLPCGEYLDVHDDAGTRIPTVLIAGRYMPSQKSTPRPPTLSWLKCGQVLFQMKRRSVIYSKNG